MEEKISLALAVKLKKIFEKEDRFLAFTPGLGYTYPSLDFMKEDSALPALDRLRFKADFARMMNLIPSDVPVFSHSDQFLWNEVKNVLTFANFADSLLSPEEEKQLADAIDFLTDEQVEPDGTKMPVPSAKAKAYTTYKIVYEQANEAYLDEELTVNNTTGEEGQRLKTIWASGREQELRGIRDQAMQNWINLGFKNGIEANQALRNTLEVKKYAALYRQAYLNEIAIAEVADVGAQGIPFCVTFFNPSDAFDKNVPWTTVHLKKEEIESLILGAPPELKNIFSSAQGNEDIESLSLEYNYVGVQRSWFRPEFFLSRYWKTSDDSLISNGETPRQGRIPAYITGLLAVRNITVVKKKGSAPQNNILPILDASALQKLRLGKQAEPIDFSAVSKKFRLSPEKVAPQPHLSLPKAGVIELIATPIKPTFAASHELVDHDVFAPITPHPVATPHPAETLFLASNLKKDAYLKAQFSDMTVKTPLQSKIPPKFSLITQPDPATETISETHDFDGIVVLAFVCRRVPKSPNPDPSLFK
jgi:hypothetical protein